MMGMGAGVILLVKLCGSLRPWSHPQPVTCLPQVATTAFSLSCHLLLRPKCHLHSAQLGPQDTPDTPPLPVIPHIPFCLKPFSLAESLVECSPTHPPSRLGLSTGAGSALRPGAGAGEPEGGAQVRAGQRTQQDRAGPVDFAGGGQGASPRRGYVSSP